MITKTIFIILTLILLIACGNESKYEITFGTKPKCDSFNWLSFDYDNVVYFHDTIGHLTGNVSNNSSVNKYFSSNKGRELNEDNIKDLNAILSCKMWCNEKDSTSYSLINPEHLVAFIKKHEVVGYISVDFYSNSIICYPKTNAREFCALKYYFRSLNKQ